MNTPNIEFKKDRYDKIKTVADTGRDWYEDEDCDLGSVMQGAVIADLRLAENEDKDKEYNIAGKYVIVIDYYVLTKDGKYGEYLNVPFDKIHGFYFSLKDTYEETIESLIESFKKNLCEKYKEALNETNVTWEKLYAYKGDVYPGFEKT